MPRYQYSVSDPEGNIQTGVVDAGSQQEALDAMRRRHLYVMSLDVQRPPRYATALALVAALLGVSVCGFIAARRTFGATGVSD